jgi:hypothetical protein
MAWEYKQSDRGAPFNPAQCKASVLQHGGWRSSQCSRKVKKDGWCGQHHPDAEKKRAEVNAEKCRAKQEAWRKARECKACPGKDKEIERLREAAIGVLKFLPNMPEMVGKAAHVTATERLRAALKEVEGE